jgi:hypothetical protein
MRSRFWPHTRQVSGGYDQSTAQIILIELDVAAGRGVQAALAASDMLAHEPAICWPPKMAAALRSLATGADECGSAV